jgi:hypothetical protein
VLVVVVVVVVVVVAVLHLTNSRVQMVKSEQTSWSGKDWIV